MPDTTNRREVLQWQEVSGESRVGLNAQMRSLGGAASGVEQQRAKLEEVRERPGNSATTQLKAERRLSTLGSMSEAGVFKDRPITHSNAAAARVSLVHAGAERARTEGTDPGHQWYFQHHQKLSTVADATGVDKHRVIAASAVMSPQNNPEQELAAVSALSMAHSNPNASITVSKEAAQRDTSLRDFVGRETHPSAFSADQIASLSSVDVRQHVETKGVDLNSVAKGGVKGNISKAVGVLRGDIPHEDAINPDTSPKVWSYHNNIAKSEWGTPEHEEFARRMRSATGMDQGQGTFNLFPELNTSTKGPLDPTGHTAEDTWQQAISTGQQLASVEIPGRVGRAHKQSPAKFTVGEGGAANQKNLRAVPGLPGVGDSVLMHTWQNRATQLAAGRMSRASGEIVPAIGVQAGGWTEGRRQAGKAMEENDKVKRVVQGGQLDLLTKSNRARKNV